MEELGDFGRKVKASMISTKGKSYFCKNFPLVHLLPAIQFLEKVKI